MRVGAGTIPPSAIGNVGDFIAVAGLDYLLDLFGGVGHNDTRRQLGHHPLIPQPALISPRPGAITLADYRVSRNILSTDNRFQYLICLSGYSHKFTPQKLYFN
jgi:hypothetical protein